MPYVPEGATGNDDDDLMETSADFYAHECDTFLTLSNHINMH
jgi:hypothetical protein